MAIRIKHTNKTHVFQILLGGLLVIRGLFSVSLLFILFYFLVLSYWVMGEYFSSVFPITICFAVTLLLFIYLFVWHSTSQLRFLFWQYFFLISKASIFSFITKFIALYKCNILLPLPKLFTMFILNFLLFVLLSLFLLLSVLFLGCLSYKGCCFQIFAMLSVGFIFRMYFCYDLPWGFSLSRDKLGFCLLLITSI